MIKTIGEVVDNHLCTSCGTCVGICSVKGAIAMHETPDGHLFPKIDHATCVDCDLCHITCPEIKMPAKLESYLAKHFTGPILGTYLAEATDEAIADKGQTGGLGRILLASALELGLADVAVSVVDNPENPLRPLTKLIETPEEALNVTRSKYCPIAVNELIYSIRRIKGKVAFMGVGCHMRGLHAAMEYLPKLGGKIAFTVGLFCDSVLTYPATDYLVKCGGGGSDDVKEFDYRHDDLRGWPGDTRVVKGDSQVSNVPIYRRHYIKRMYTPIACRLCVDKLNVLCDLALGDPYGLVKRKHVGDRHVPTALIVRTEIGQAVLQELEKAGKIKVWPADEEVMVNSQKIDANVAQGIAYGREMAKRGFELPPFLQRGPFKVTGEERRLRAVKWSVGFQLLSQTERGLRIVGRIPIWMPYMLGFLQRYSKLIRNRLRRVWNRLWR